MRRIDPDGVPTAAGECAEPNRAGDCDEPNRAGDCDKANRGVTSEHTRDKERGVIAPCARLGDDADRGVQHMADPDLGATIECIRGVVAGGVLIEKMRGVAAGTISRSAPTSATSGDLEAPSRSNPNPGN